jgi:hypothetical protein
MEFLAPTPVVVSAPHTGVDDGVLLRQSQYYQISRDCRLMCMFGELAGHPDLNASFRSEKERKARSDRGTTLRKTTQNSGDGDKYMPFVQHIKLEPGKSARGILKQVKKESKK